MARDLRIRLLGQLAVEGTATAELGSRKSRTLLRVLALARGNPVALDTLADILWGSAPPSVPGDQLSVLVSRLRSVLGPERLTRSDAGYALRSDWLDVDAASELLDQAAARLAAGSPASARAAVNGCLALLRGPLLADEPEAPWAAAERAAVERMELDVRRLGAEVAVATGDRTAALDLAESVLDRDPYDEHALQLAMTALAGSGRAGVALQRYESMRERLSEELGVDPSPETRALHMRILTQSQPAGPAVALAPGKRNLPGRAAALVALDTAFDYASEGQTWVVNIVGEAGIGKTELIETWASGSPPGIALLRGRCDSVGRTLSLQPVIDALQSHLRAHRGPDAERLLAAGGPVAVALLDWRREPGEPPPLEADTELGHALVSAALLRVVSRISEVSPVVMILDDLHFAGTATVDWVHFAQANGTGMRLLVLAAQRPEEGRWLSADHTIELQPLDLDATRKVVGVGNAAELHRRSGGNPLFLVELAGAGTGDSLPSSIREAVAARCDRAGPAAPTLRNAAVIGSAIDLDLLAAVTSQAPVVLLDHLEEGVRRGILEEGTDGFRFRHALVRDALSAEAGPARRALLHREAGRALAARPQPEPLAVAHHARLGGDLEAAASALVQAAGIAAARFDHRFAGELLDEALALQDDAAPRLARARIHMLGGRYQQAGADARAALDLGGGARALEMAGVAAYYQRRLGDARDLAEQGLQLAADAASRAGCMVISARALHALGDLPAADQRITEAIAVATAAGLPAPTAILGIIRVHQGRATEALEVLAGGLDSSAQVYPAFSPLHAQFITSYALATLGRADDALRGLDAASHEVRRLEISRYCGLADAWRGWILRQLGSLAEADDCNRAAAEAAARAGYVEAEAYSHLDLMEGRLLAGDVDAAATRLAFASDLGRVEHAYRWRHRLRGHWLRGRLSLETGDIATALELATTLQTDAASLSSARYVILARLLAVRAYAAAGIPVDAGATAADLALLDELAGLEAWWLTAELAHAVGVESWWELARARVARLAAAAGERGADFERYAATRLDRIRTSTRTGPGLGSRAHAAPLRE